MAEKRKLLAEIDKTFKKIDEGLDDFQDIMSKLLDANSDNQRDKLQDDLKKEIKKLQRFRDSVKGWLNNPDVKEKDKLLDYRKLIEQRMEQFKDIERENKTKPHSKVGLCAEEKVDPIEKEKQESVEWFQAMIADLKLEVDRTEATIESLQQTEASAPKKGRKGKDDKKAMLLRVEESRKHLERVSFHMQQLELCLRLLNNETLKPGSVMEILRDQVELYVQSLDPEYDGQNGASSTLDPEAAYEELGLDQLAATLGNIFNLSETSCNELQNSFDMKRTGDDGLNRSRRGSSQSPMMTRTPPTKKPVARIISEPQPSKAADESRSSPTPTVSAPTIPYNSIVAGVKCSSASELSERAITEVSAEPIAPAIQISTTEYPTINENLPPPAPSVAPKAPIAPPPVVAEPELPHRGHESRARSQRSPVRASPAATPIIPKANSAVDGVIIQALSRMGSQANSLPTMSSPSVSDEVTGFTSAPPPPPPPPPKPPAASVQVDGDMRPEMALSPKAPEPVKQKRLRIPPPERAAIDRVLGRSTESKPERTENLKARLHQITPSLGACPLGPGSLTEGLVLQLKAIEAQMARRPIQFDWNKSTPQFSSRPTTIPTYFPSAPPHVSSSPEYFDRLAPETLFFLFYYSEGTEAQLLSARALKKASWRFHYGYHTWFQRKTTPHEITDTFEKGTYIYWDCEAWNYGQREDFCFEYRYLEDEDREARKLA